MAATLTNFFTPETVDSWAWRLPFLFGLLIGPVGLYIRRNVPETEAFQRLDQEKGVPFKNVFLRFPRELFISTALSAALNVMSYVIIVYLPIFAVQSLGMPASLPFNVLLASVLLRVATVPLFGHLADRFGPKRIMGFALAAFLAVLYPSYLWIIRAPSLTSIMTVELGFALLIAASSSPVPAATAELFPTEVRSTGLAISYNVAASVFGGFSPFILTWLVHTTGDKLMPAHYCAIFFGLGLIGVSMLRPDDARTAATWRRTESS
jgi:MFS family permease